MLAVVFKRHSACVNVYIAAQDKDALDKSPDTAYTAGKDRHEDLRYSAACVAEVKAVYAERAQKHSQEPGNKP